MKKLTRFLVLSFFIFFTTDTFAQTTNKVTVKDAVKEKVTAMLISEGILENRTTLENKIAGTRENIRQQEESLKQNQTALNGRLRPKINYKT